MTGSCPRCGHHDRTTQVDLPEGRFFCSCGTLFNGDDREWRGLAEYRRYAIERRVGTSDDHVYEEAS